MRPFIFLLSRTSVRFAVDTEEGLAMSVSKVIAKAWSDPAFKDKLVSNPRAAFSEYGIEVPEGMRVNIVEDTPGTMNFVLPAAPRASSDQLTLDELEQTAGAGFSDGCGCSPTCMD